MDELINRLTAALASGNNRSSQSGGRGRQEHKSPLRLTVEAFNSGIDASLDAWGREWARAMIASGVPARGGRWRIEMQRPPSARSPSPSASSVGRRLLEVYLGLDGSLIDAEGSPLRVTMIVESMDRPPVIMFNSVSYHTNAATLGELKGAFEDALTQSARVGGWGT